MTVDLANLSARDLTIIAHCSGYFDSYVGATFLNQTIINGKTVYTYAITFPYNDGDGYAKGVVYVTSEHGSPKRIPKLEY